MARRVPLSSTKVQEGTGVCYSQSGSVPAVGDLGDLNSIADSVRRSTLRLATVSAATRQIES